VQNIGTRYKTLCALDIGARQKSCAHWILVCGIKFVRIG
jgi:hypothetical protein